MDSRSFRPTRLFASSPQRWIPPLAFAVAGSCALTLVATFSFLLLPSVEDIAAEQQRRASAIHTAAEMPKGSIKKVDKPLLRGVQPASNPGLNRPSDARKYFPANGAQWEFGWEAKLPLDQPFAPVSFRDSSGDGLKKVLRIRRHGDPELLATVYLRPGTADSTSLPAGIYDVSLARGNAWYGASLLFGRDGRYYARQTLEIPQSGRFLELLPPSKESSTPQARVRMKDF